MQCATRLRLRAKPVNPPHNNTFNHLNFRFFSTSTARLDNSAETLENLRIGSETRVIFQGFTGRQATANAQESIKWGTNIVGGVTPGREGTHLGLPLLPSVRRAMVELKPDATGIYVPASAAIAAIEEAIEAEVPLIVAVAEHIPLHDMLRIHAMLKTQTKSRLVGPNSPGIISAADGERCRIGFQPLPCFSAGCVGIAAKSGTLSYEAVASTTRAGLGQSLCIGVGGDVLPGTNLVEALQVLAADPATRAIALIGEIGGEGEVHAAEWIRDYYASTPPAERKPIAALVAGRCASFDAKVFGHAGAFWMPGEPSAKQKIAVFDEVGAIRIVNHPARFGEALREMLEARSGEAAKLASTAMGDFVNKQTQQFRGFHTAARRLSLLTYGSRPIGSRISRAVQPRQTRSLSLNHIASSKLLKENLSDATQQNLVLDPYPIRYLALTIDRTTRAQCLITGLIPGQQAWSFPSSFHRILLPPGVADIQSLDLQEYDAVCQAVLDHLQLYPRPENQLDAELPKMRLLLRDLDHTFRTKEAKLISLEFHAVHASDGIPIVHNTRIDLDDAAVRSGNRPRLRELHRQLGRLNDRAPGALTAAEAADGMVYHRLQPQNAACNIGTVVNGAGLAMNTVDALFDAGGRAANFLDTGGKATAETVKRAFEVVLRDRRVKVVFVNIFGGLTLGDMIAHGIILAFKELQVAVPVVVRIRGTNEAEGQQIIAQSGLPLFAFDDFDEAAAKAIELAKEAEAQLKGGEEAGDQTTKPVEAAGVVEAEQKPPDRQKKTSRRP